MTSRYIDGSRVVYWDDLTGNLTVPATLTATSVVGASFTLGPNVTFSSVTASTINVGSLTTPVVSTLKVNASSITANTVSSLSAQTSSLVANNLSSLTVRTSSLVTNNLSSLTAQTGVLTATRTTVSSLVGNNVSSLTAQIKNITVSSLIGLPTTFYVLAAATNPSYGSTLTMNYSYDLVNWTPVQTSFYGSIGGSAVRVKKINGVYFAMGFNNANQTVLTPLLRSVDGINWVKPTSIPVEANNDITLTNIMYGNNLYVAVGRNGCQGYVWRSTDGQTWTDSTTSATTGLFYPDPGCGSAGIQDVAYGNGTWVVVGGSASYYGTYYSTDGITFLFSTSNPMSGSATSVDFDGTKFIQVGFDSLPWRWSTDGITWSYLVFSGDLAWTNNAKNIAYNGTMWLATGFANELKYSYDGFAWTNVPSGGLVSGATYNLLSWNGSRWFAGLLHPTASFAYSSDGLTWTAGSVPSINTTTNANNYGNYVYAIEPPPLVNMVGDATVANTLTASSIVGTTVSASTLQAINAITSYITATSSLVAPAQFYAQELYTKDAYDYASFGTSFVQTESSRAWNSIAVSANGQYQTAVVNAPGFIYSSSDFGTTWTQVATSQGWAQIAMSATGQIQVAAIGMGRLSYTGQIYRSTDYGATWAVLSGSPTKYWADLAISASAQYMTAIEQNPTGYIWSSSDYGVTWVQSSSAPLAEWGGVSLSASGQFQTTAVYAGMIYRSSDYGQTWVSTGAARDNFASVAVSASGQYQTFASQTGGIGQGRLYVSSDYGATWTNTYGPSAIAFIEVAMSASGRYQMAITTTTVYSSSTYGTSWTVSATVGSFLYDVAMSASGNYSVLVDSNPGFIYESTLPLLLPTTSSLSAQVGIFTASKATASSIVSLTMSTGSLITRTLTVSSVLGFSPISFVNDVIFTSTVIARASLSTVSIQTSSITATTVTSGSISSLTLNVGTLTANTFTPPPATSVSTFTVYTSSLVANNVSSLTEQTGSLLANNVSSLTAQTGVLTGLQAIVSSLAANNVSSFVTQTSSLVANNLSSLTERTGSLVANNVSSLTAQTGSLLANNVSSLTAQTGVLTGLQAIMSSLTANNVSSFVTQTSSLVANNLSSLTERTGSLLANNVSSLTEQTGSLLANNVSSLTAQTGALTGLQAIVSSLTANNVSSLVTQTSSLVANNISTTALQTSSILVNGLVGGSISTLTLNVGTLTATSFTPPPATSVSTFTVNTSSLVANNLSSLTAQTGVFTATQATVSSLVANNVSSLTARTSTLVANTISSLSEQTGVFTATQATVSSLVANNISSLTAQTGSLLGTNVSSLAAQTSSLVANNLSSLTARTSTLVANNLSSLTAQVGILTTSTINTNTLNVSTVLVYASSQTAPSTINILNYNNTTSQITYTPVSQIISVSTLQGFFYGTTSSIQSPTANLSVSYGSNWQSLNSNFNAASLFTKSSNIMYIYGNSNAANTTHFAYWTQDYLNYAPISFSPDSTTLSSIRFFKYVGNFLYAGATRNGNSNFYMGNGGTTLTLITAPVTFSTTTGTLAGSMDVAYGNSRYVIVGEGDFSGALYSTDGVTFASTATSQLFGVANGGASAIGSDNVKFVAGSYSTRTGATDCLRTSTDGATWTGAGFSGATDFGTASINNIVHNGSYWMLATNTNTGGWPLRYSTDGLFWQHVSTGVVSTNNYSNLQWNGVCWYVMNTQGVSSIIQCSGNGLSWSNWTTIPLSTIQSFYAIPVTSSISYTIENGIMGNPQITLSTAGTYQLTVPSQFNTVQITLMGGGGGGGISDYTSQQGGGGGGSGYVSTISLYSMANQPVFFTIGTGGYAPGGSSVPGGNGLSTFCYGLAGNTLQPIAYVLGGQGGQHVGSAGGIGGNGAYGGGGGRGGGGANGAGGIGTIMNGGAGNAVYGGYGAMNNNFTTVLWSGGGGGPYGGRGSSSNLASYDAGSGTLGCGGGGGRGGKPAGAGGTGYITLSMY